MAKMRTMLQTALDNGNDSVVLSAFGCGAFYNDPRLIATWYKEIIRSEFAGRFRKIAFGIIDDHNARGNLSTFQHMIIDQAS